MITAIETIWIHAHLSNLLMQVHTDDRLVGLGETVGELPATARIVHELLDPILIDNEPGQIERLGRACYRVSNYYRGWRARNASAQWARHRAVGPDGQGRRIAGPRSAQWHLTEFDNQAQHLRGLRPDPGPSLFQDRSCRPCPRAGLVRNHRDEVWPFDALASRNQGLYLSEAEVLLGACGIRQTREQLGSSVEVAVEGHGLWSFLTATRSAKGLEEFAPIWIENMVLAEKEKNPRRLTSFKTIPVVARERLMSLCAFRRIVENQAADVVVPGVSRTGRSTEARKIAAAAETKELTVAPHNCSRPISHIAKIHLAAHIPNLFMLETIRACYLYALPELGTGVPAPENGRVPGPDAPGPRPGLTERVLRAVDRISERSTTSDLVVSALAFADSGPR